MLVDLFKFIFVLSVAYVVYVFVSVLFRFIGPLGSLISVWISLIVLVSLFLLLYNRVKYLRSCVEVVSLVYWVLMYVLYAMVYYELLFIGVVLVLSYLIFRYKLHEVILGFLHSVFSSVIEVKDVLSRSSSRSFRDDVSVLGCGFSGSSLNVNKIDYELIYDLDSDEARILLELINSDGLSKKELSERIPEFSYKRVRKIVNELYKKNLVFIEKKRVRHSKGSYLVHIVRLIWFI